MGHYTSVAALWGTYGLGPHTAMPPESMSEWEQLAYVEGAYIASRGSSKKNPYSFGTKQSAAWEQGKRAFGNKGKDDEHGENPF